MEFPIKGRTQESEKYTAWRKRLRKRFYYGGVKFFRKEDVFDRLSMPLSGVAMSYFDHQAPFDYLDEEFAMRISREGCVDPCCFLVALVYLEKMRTMDKQRFETSDPSELYLTALVLASKYLYDPGEDESAYNDEWATSAGIDLARLNQLEIDFLKATEWQLSVSKDNFEDMLMKVETRAAIAESEKRNWYSYTEALVLLDAILKQNPTYLKLVLDSMLRTIAALVATYIGLTLSVLGISSFVAASLSGTSDMQASTSSADVSEQPRCDHPHIYPNSNLDMIMDTENLLEISLDGSLANHGFAPAPLAPTAIWNVGDVRASSVLAEVLWVIQRKRKWPDFEKARATECEPRNRNHCETLASAMNDTRIPVMTC